MKICQTRAKYEYIYLFDKCKIQRVVSAEYNNTHIQNTKSTDLFPLALFKTTSVHWHGIKVTLKYHESENILEH